MMVASQATIIRQVKKSVRYKLDGNGFTINQVADITVVLCSKIIVSGVLIIHLIYKRLRKVLLLTNGQ